MQGSTRSSTHDSGDQLQGQDRGQGSTGRANKGRFSETLVPHVTHDRQTQEDRKCDVQKLQNKTSQ